MKNITSILICLIILTPLMSISAQTKEVNPTFNKVKILQQEGDEINQRSVIVTFLEDEITINSDENNVNKTFKYADIKNVEYSYSKTPRWKSGLGLGATAVLFPPILLVAIPLGFTKHKRHWLTIKTEDDYAVLKLSKGDRKIFMPTFETKSGITIEAVGEDK